MAKILIIDDNSERILQMREAIRYQRFDCRTAPVSPNAVELIRTRQPDLVVLGLASDTAETRDLCDLLRDELPFEDLPILIVGDHHQLEDAIACIECGADDWLALPLPECLIEARIRALLSHRRECQHLRERDRTLKEREEALDATTDTLDHTRFLLEQARENERILATHDRVTGIPNRQLFDEFLERSLNFARRHDHTLAVLCLDLDRFELINDSLSHSIGDQVLRSVAQRATACVRSSEMVARMGGDEFVTSLLHLSAPSDAVTVAKKILVDISRPHKVAGQEVRITPSIGIAIYPDHGESGDELVRSAKFALRAVKKDGGNGHRFFEPSMDQKTPRRERLELDLRAALERDQLVLYYQPQFDARKGTLIGSEALVRWNHPEFGLVSPAEFIPIAEESGLIGDIGAWVMRRACAQKRTWERSGFGEFPISVNVSFAQLVMESFAELMVMVLAETSLPPEHLDIEITENMIMDDVESARETLTRLSEIGVRVSIDDFGTGYSSLSVLGTFPAHTLKIDRAFVADIASSPVKATIARTIIAVASQLGMRTIAEGVETEEQMEILGEFGCELMQGYLFGHPVDAAEFERTWSDGRSEIALAA